MIDGKDKVICTVCVHSNGYRCNSPKIVELVALITGLEINGADAGTFSMRLSESACGISGKWWEPRP
jgi:hypothetical protein